MKAEYEKRIKSFLLDRTWYKLVDALEEVTNFWSYGRDFTTMPTYNIYIPTRNNIMNRPNMADGDKDDLSYRYDVNRMSPYHYLNTLKGYPMKPAAADRPVTNFFKPRFYHKWRRLSRPKMQGFSTVNNRQEGNGLWY